MSDINRVYEMTFPCRPTIREIMEQLTQASKIFSEYTRVPVSTNGSSDPDLEEVRMVVES